MAYAVLHVSLHVAAARADWLISPPTQPVVIENVTVAGGRPAVRMSNGLINRTFLRAPNWVSELFI